MSRYCQYCTDASVSVYFWNRTLSNIYGALGSLYHSKGMTGEFFHEERVRIAKRLAAIQNEAWRDHDQANQEYWQAKRDAKLAKDFKDKQFLGLSDLHLTFKTPSGGIHFGLKDGKWGVHLDMDNNYIKPRPLRLKGMKQEPVPNENANNFLQLTLEKTLSTLGQMLTGTDIVDKAISVVKGATTELVETKTSNKTDLFRDSGGNYHINRQQTERIIFAGKLEGRSDYYQVGGVKLRKNSAAFNLSDFLSFSAGGYSR